MDGNKAKRKGRPELPGDPWATYISVVTGSEVGKPLSRLRPPRSDRNSGMVSENEHPARASGGMALPCKRPSGGWARSMKSQTTCSSCYLTQNQEECPALHVPLHNHPGNRNSGTNRDTHSMPCSHGEREQPCLS